MSKAEDSMSDDVFVTSEDDKTTVKKIRSPHHSKQQHISHQKVTEPATNKPENCNSSPAKTGYRGEYTPPVKLLKQPSNGTTTNSNILHKTILLGDSGVGKTTLLVRFNTGQFQTSNFSATVGIGFTLMILGDSGVGKTCVLLKFRDNAFLSGNFISTVGIDFRNKVIDVDDKKVKLQIWDTAGQERFRSVTHAYYRDAHALLLLYDVTNQASFDNIRAWLVEIKEYAQDDVVIMLIGNKADCKSSERSIRKEDGEKLAKEYSVVFMETSAKTGQNVEIAFIAIARQLLSKQNGNDNSDNASFNVHEYIREHTERSSACPSCNI